MFGLTRAVLEPTIYRTPQNWPVLEPTIYRTPQNWPVLEPTIYRTPQNWLKNRNKES